MELLKDYHKDNIHPRVALKLEIAKAFNTVRWDFIICSLQAMGLLLMLMKWIKSCISKAVFFVCLNGKLEGFSLARGV